ncbi:MAG TPA: tannase/feruloyl esterase family alpha/beta hydrolase [Burkholderiales bacterium]|nr:tannase/feruloyl esterase family alpha/beta hydrolase [Burkholderiales bacterium]
MRHAAAVSLTAFVLGFALAPASSEAKDRREPPHPVTCADLATDPANGLVGNPVVKSVNSTMIPAAGANVAYCQVDLLYGTNPNQNINIRVGLPLNSLDGGTGGVQGAWNGRTQGIGGGGCAGSLNVNAPVNAGYVGSGTDTGHSGGNCEPGVNADGTYNFQFIQDFIRNAIKQQVLFSKSIAATYYGAKPAYNYWNGCSTGGRQGYLLAQELGKELDGVLANAPAIYWTRFQTAQMWGQIVMKDVAGGPIAAAKLNQTSASAVAACDAADGVTDGVIDDPRTCKFSATANICGTPTAPATNCLTATEAEAIDKIWDGPRNANGNKIWFGLDRGTNLSGLNGTNPFALGVTQFHWDEHDRTFDWKTVSEDGYPQVAQDGSRNIADVTDTFGDLDTFRRHGGKLLTFVGGNDQLIMPRGVINYYRQMASRYGKHGEPDFDRLQDFYRLFRAPGVGHCGGGAGPQPQGLFDALVEWVEQGNAPDTILAQSTTGGTTRTRPLCPYPTTAIYNGSGGTDDAANFHCGGNLEKRRVVCADVLTKYKNEVDGRLDFKGTGVDRGECRRGSHSHGHDDDGHDDDHRRW